MILFTAVGAGGIPGRHLPRVSLRPTDPNQLKEKKHKLNCSLGYIGKRNRIKHELRAEFSLRGCKLMVLLVVMIGVYSTSDSRDHGAAISIV